MTKQHLSTSTAPLFKTINLPTAKIFALWEDYANNIKIAAELVKACAYINGPVRGN